MSKINYLSPFKKLCVTIGELPTAYIESMSYYECLTYLVNYLTNNVIPVVNENSEAVNEVQSKYVELVNYVDNYFDNLDVQEEINNKLDDMANKGELTSIILEYLDLGGLVVFDTIADMQATENAVDGGFMKTAGSLLYNDGHQALYRVREIDEEDVIDDVELVSLTNFPDLVAEKLTDYAITSLESNVSTLGTEIGDLTNLTTTSKTSVVSAINEVDSNADSVNSKVGELTNLTTTSKTNVVSAINELNTYPIFNLSQTYQAYRIASQSDTVQITAGKFYTGTSTFTATSSGLSEVYCNVMGATNTEGSVGKVYGVIFFTANYTVNATNGFPCIRLRCSDFGIAVPDSGYYIWSAGNCFCSGLISCASIYVGSDGYLYLHGDLNVTASSARYALIFNPCLYFWKDFGDVPDNE